MQTLVWLRYLFGNAAAIRQVASDRNSIWAGIFLVILTAIARNYDQTFIPEDPFLWFFGPLIFSFVSGSWLYLVSYGLLARREMVEPTGSKPHFWSGWSGFMGLFWMMAPIAWLYAIPVERFMEPLDAAKVNLALLGLVSVWRVLLMTRVIQVTTKAPFLMALVWVLLPVATEIVGLFVFGGGLGRAIMKSMAGLRNSPEEELVERVMGQASGIAFWTVPIAFLLALFWRTSRVLQPLPRREENPKPWIPLGVGAAFWVVVAIAPQIELANSVKVRRLISDGKARDALELMASHQPGDFAPARRLGPNSYGFTAFQDVPTCFEAIQPSDPPWVRQHLIHRLDEIYSQYGPIWMFRPPSMETLSREGERNRILEGLKWLGPEAGDLSKLLTGLNKIPEGRDWLKRHGEFLEALQIAVRGKESIQARGSSLSDARQEMNRLALSNLVQSMLTTNLAGSNVLR